MFLSTVLEGVFMIVESGFKCVGGKADIGLVRFVVISGYCSLIYNRLREALAEEWAFLAFSAVAFVSFWFIEFHKDGLVVTVNGLFDVGHTGVANFDCIPVEYFVTHMVLMEFFV